ncbi:MAG: 4Fe-4S binding protein [Clostridiales bacterium]|nr:4Fe-4S binding protein [Clostridiales bacterium]
MLRKIIKIDEELCNGCGLCAGACHEGAIEIINGKAKLVNDKYCDGLGNCLPACPTGAIEIVERDTVEFDEEAVTERMEGMKQNHAEKKKEEVSSKNAASCQSSPGGGCPGSRAFKLKREPVATTKSAESSVKNTGINNGEIPSELNQWPIQLKLVNPQADYLEGANLLIAADCTAFSYGAFHRDFIRNHVTLIGCPKLDDVEVYIDKLEFILANNDIKSVKVIRMEVPCCGGIVRIVKEAMLRARKIIPYNEVVIGINGEIRSN